MELRRLRTESVERDPRPGARHLFVHTSIPFILRMNPNELYGTDLLTSDDFQLLHGRSPVAGVRSNRQSGLKRSDRRCSYQLAVEFIERSLIDANLDEPWPPGLTSLRHPAFRELGGRFISRKRRHKLMVRRAVQTCVRPDL